MRSLCKEKFEGPSKILWIYLSALEKISKGKRIGMKYQFYLSLAGNDDLNYTNCRLYSIIYSTRVFIISSSKTNVGSKTTNISQNKKYKNAFQMTELIIKYSFV
jgi:hypothetical protein